MKKLTSGLYFLYKERNLVYIGKSKNIFYRIGTHIKEGVKDFDNWRYLEINDEEEMTEKETFLINIFQPKYNEQIWSTVSNKDNGTDTEIKELLEEIDMMDVISVRTISKITGINIYSLIAVMREMDAPMYREELLYVNRKWFIKNYGSIKRKCEE